MVVIIIFFRIWIPTEFSLSITWWDADRLVVKILYSTQRTQIFMLCFTFREIPLEKTNLFKSEIIVRSMSYFLLMWQKHTMSSRIQGHLYSGVCRYKYIHKQPRQRVCFFLRRIGHAKCSKTFSRHVHRTLSCIQRIETVFSIFITFDVHTTKLQIFHSEICQKLLVYSYSLTYFEFLYFTYTDSRINVPLVIS